MAFCQPFGGRRCAAAHEKVGQISKSQVLVPGEGVEPSWVAPRDFESRASASSATRACARIDDREDMG